MKSSVECDILIIDNASTDNTKERVGKYIDNKKTFYYNTGENIGGAGGFNLGIKIAYERLVLSGRIGELLCIKTNIMKNVELK